MTDMTREALAEALRLIAAWHTPGGPTPKQKCPEKHIICVEAAAFLDALASAPAAQAQSEPLTTRQIEEEVGRYQPQFRPPVRSFFQGVRFAERHHGITKD